MDLQFFCKWSQKSEARDTRDAQVLLWGTFENVLRNLMLISWLKYYGVEPFNKNLG
jgi:hypothetical protein